MIKWRDLTVENATAESILKAYKAKGIDRTNLEENNLLADLIGNIHREIIFCMLELNESATLDILNLIWEPGQVCRFWAEKQEFNKQICSLEKDMARLQERHDTLNSQYDAMCSLADDFKKEAAQWHREALEASDRADALEVQITYLKAKLYDYMAAETN